MQIKPLIDIEIKSEDQEINFVKHCDASEDLVLIVEEGETIGGRHNIVCPVLKKETELRGRYCLNEWCPNWRERIT